MIAHFFPFTNLASGPAFGLRRDIIRQPLVAIAPQKICLPSAFIGARQGAIISLADWGCGVPEHGFSSTSEDLSPWPSDRGTIRLEGRLARLSQFGWKSESSVKDWLFAEGYKFDFYQAVRLLEMLLPDCESAGEGFDPHQEAVRFQSNNGLSFPASDVQEVVSPAGQSLPARMLVNFLGLAGAHGPLPHPFTELILERIRQRDTALRDFLDIFNHRLVSLMYRAGKVHRVSLTSKSPEQSPITGYLYSFLGLGLPPLRERMKVKDRSLLFYSGLVCQEPRSAAGLEHVLADYFQVRVSLREFEGQWQNLEPDQWTRLGRSGNNQLLGQNTVLGKRYWDQQGCFQVQLGPMSFLQFLDFLPNGSAYQPLCELVRFYAGMEFNFSFSLKILPYHVPQSRLGRTRLGWTSWLNTQHFRKEGAQVTLRSDSQWGKAS